MLSHWEMDDFVVMQQKKQTEQDVYSTGTYILVFIFGGLCEKRAVPLRIRLSSLPLFQDEKTMTMFNVLNLVDA